MHGSVGDGDQPVVGVAVLGQPGDAPRHTGGPVEPLDRDLGACRHPDGLLAFRCREGWSATCHPDPERGVGAAAHRRQGSRRRPQQPVAGRVTAAVVDLLEAVEVEDHEAEHDRRIAGRLVGGACERLPELTMVP